MKRIRRPRRIPFNFKSGVGAEIWKNTGIRIEGQMYGQYWGSVALDLKAAKKILKYLEVAVPYLEQETRQ